MNRIQPIEKLDLSGHSMPDLRHGSRKAQAAEIFALAADNTELAEQARKWQDAFTAAMRGKVK